MGVPAFDSVITMLQNLIARIDQEVASDEQDYGNFMSWFDTQSKATESSIGMLSSRLQELAAVLADLRSRQHKLSTEVARLNSEIAETQDQIAQAKDKRAQEHESFVQEQLDFDNSIAACNKAVEILQVSLPGHRIVINHNMSSIVYGIVINLLTFRKIPLLNFGNICLRMETASIYQFMILTTTEPDL